ncbi:hypothetical protein GT037_001505 [Alternaria burnsii]|uniref:Protein kinase domain-containing protein n=1 Tax=Alternaria burnsii TaxID=1187904 RepID=A0A8H7B9G8_9PLEO|nr:uncharacterized protein GT037_001505 [Alternaria burnsii]KAF7679854.1 hypothetical protein GT037_001505 [Alternaria burnsii]CAI9629178.1 unnamed protein product [Alternaria burnsii]
MCPARTSSKEPIDEVIKHLIPHAPHQMRHLKYATIFKIQQQLGRHNDFKQWSDKPRLFTLLRMLQCDNNILNRFLDAGVNDYLLPLTGNFFMGLGVEMSWTEFRAAQRYVLLHPEDMSESYLQGDPNRHHNLEDGDDVFQEAGELGEGGTATVSTVRLTTFDISDNERLYACKRLARENLREQKKHLQPFIDELHILRKISHSSTARHPHMVRLVASYTDLRHFAFVLHPVADCSLKDMLESANLLDRREDFSSLRRWFGCLASALVYLHGQSIRHKDIKPGNILMHNGTVYLCDFGISLDWNGSHPTTEGPSARTRGYCAPEVLNAKARDSRSDVWSLGRVFCDMLTVLAGSRITELLERIGGDLHGIYDDRYQDDLHRWLSDFSFESTPHDCSRRSIQRLVEEMMYKDKNSRPNAEQVLQWFCESNSSLIGPCCKVESEAASIKRSEEEKVQEEADKNAKEEEKNAKEEGKGAVKEQKKAKEDAKKREEEAEVRVAKKEEKKQEEVDKKATEDEKQQQEKDKFNNGFVAGETESLTSLPLGRTSTTIGCSTILAESSIGSQHPVQWSSGAVHYPELPPVDSRHTCNCGPRTKERLILCVLNVHLFIKAKQPTMEMNENCDLHKDMLYVYESYSGPNSEKWKIWHKTRRLVISYKPEPHSQRICSSFWLPLTDVNFVVQNMSLTLGWSDCNQWNLGRTVNNKPSWDCIYDSENTNNEIVLLFTKAGMAKVVERNLCTIFSKLDGVKEWRMIEIMGQQRLLVVDVRDRNQEPIRYRLACLATYELPSRSTFRAFIHWSNLDLDIQIKSGVMVIRFDQVSTPHYYSDINNEPWKDETKIARYTGSALVLSEYSMTFPCSFGNSTFLPEGLKQMFESLTGWTMCFFASDVEIKKTNTLPKTNYGESDVILWKRCLEVQSSVRQVAQITFRHRNRMPGKGYLWRSGSVNVGEMTIVDSQQAAINISCKSHGSQLDTTTMTAIEVGDDGYPVYQPDDASSTRLKLRFRSDSDLTEFMIRYQELQQVVKSQALLRVTTTASSRLSSSSRRRDSGTAHANRRSS